jgi:hypothetical protein
VNRQHILFLGLLLFFAGIQFRMVESFTLSEKSSHFVSAQMGHAGQRPQGIWGNNLPGRKVVEPPKWLGFALMSVGSVLTLKSLTMGRGA